MEALAAHAPAVAEIDVLVDVGLVEVDQPVLIALSTVQQGAQLGDEGVPPVRISAAEQLLGFLPRQADPVQRGADGLAAAQAGEPHLHKADQPLQRPAWLWVSPDYGRRGCVLPGSADFRVESRCDVWTKGGRPPVRRYSSASGPCSP